MNEIRAYLLKNVCNDTYYALTEGNDVFNGVVLVWFVKAQTATFLLEALSQTEKQFINGFTDDL